MLVMANIAGLRGDPDPGMTTAQGRLEPLTAWRLILLAALANIVFKGTCACVLGSPALRVRIAVLFGLALAGGAAILLLWS